MYKIVTLVFVSVFFAGIVFAQGSPFGNLSEDGANRMYNSIDGRILQDYLAAKESYNNLDSLYERAYGTRKDELLLQIVGRAKDVLISKLGATKSYLFSTVGDVSSSGRLSEEVISSLDLVSKSYNTKADELGAQVEGMETLEDLIEVAKLVNTEILNTLNSYRVATTTLNVARGENLIEKINTILPIIFEHISASAVLGGDVQDAQESYDSANLLLESAKELYASASLKISVDPDDLSQAESDITKANKDLVEAQEDLTEILKELRVLYSNSPWEIDETKF